jgi:hypothetical protein
MFGRSANRVDEGMLTEDKLQEAGLGPYGEHFGEVMEWVWKNIGEKVVQNSKVMKALQHPKTHLTFKEYEIGEFFFHRRIAKRFYKDAWDEKVHKLNAKLQYRWTGPYIITNKVSPVLYEADIHDVKKMVHAINMRPY